MNSLNQDARYCEHFQFLKVADHIHIDTEASCKFCFTGRNNLWICLSKNCGTYVCGRSGEEHLLSHLQQSRKSKKFHSVFINAWTAEIRCIQCQIQICDLDIPLNAGNKNKNDPYPVRLKILPALAEFITHKIVGQLQNSEGHRKISRGLVGIFSTKYNYSINAAIQFIAHCSLMKDLLLQINPKNNKTLGHLKEVVFQIQNAHFRAILTEKISELLFKEMPDLLGYKRKDPFTLVQHFFTVINHAILFYTLTEAHPEQIDEWDLFYKKNQVRPNYIIYKAIESSLNLNYGCPKCKTEISVPHNIQFLKLNIPKKKRKTKEIEKELAAHRCQSPNKNRRKSLVNLLWKQQQLPLTIPQLLIELMKQPLHKQMTCQNCNVLMKKYKINFQRLPDYLIIQIARMTKQGSQIDETPVQFSTMSLDLGPFSTNPQEEILYDFECAVCIQKGCLYPIVLISKSNKQEYIIRNETVQLLKQKVNPYLLCYKRRPSETAKQKYTQILDSLSKKVQQTLPLPDFWLTQLKHGIERPLHHQIVCKHNNLKPNIQSLMQNHTSVSHQIYQDLLHFYNKQESNQKRCYNKQICEECLYEQQQLNIRRKNEREEVLRLDKTKGQAIPYCMIASSWIKKWSNYLYSKQKINYMMKGYPFPPSIDNKVLLEGNKCKPGLVKNQHFKIINIYLWRFLKQLYGGGPQIRYKWKEGKEMLSEQLISDIRYQAYELKSIYNSSYLQSPKKLMTSVSFIEKSTLIEGVNDSFLQPQMIQEPEEDA